MACLQNGNSVFNKFSNYDENSSSNLNINNTRKSYLNNNCKVTYKNTYTKDNLEIPDNKNQMQICDVTNTESQDNDNCDQNKNKKNIENINKIKQDAENLKNETKNKLLSWKNEDFKTVNLRKEINIKQEVNEDNISLKNCIEDWMKLENVKKKTDYIKTEKNLSWKQNEDYDQNYNKSTENVSWKKEEIKTEPDVCTEDNDWIETKINSNDMDQLVVKCEEVVEPAHHARRPMNAFLIFCKRHRTVVKDKYPHLENRAVTKILGEWWAGLEPDEKSCYTELAKQYKNAFFSANPGFKWYKLPAPPLRTLNTRPANVIKVPLTKKVEATEEAHCSHEILFNPGKLADETQLGSITSLIQLENQHGINRSDLDKQQEEADVYQDSQLSPPVTLVSLSQPPKPFKKRIIHQNKDNKNVVRSIFNTDDSYTPIEDSFSLDRNATFTTQLNNNTNVTQQDLIDKVVDHMCSSMNGSEQSECLTCNNRQSKKEQRTSVRTCKGVRYAQFMVESKLLVNKRNKKSLSTQSIPYQSLDEPSYQVPKHESIELNETIKKLAERTGKINEYANEIPDDNMKKMFRAADFNLDAKIEALPSLSLEKFQQKKKENKKKKFFRSPKIVEKKDKCDEAKPITENNNSLIGSRKRKPRKQSITRLDPQDNKFNLSQNDADLFGLATLAEVAAKKAKLDQ